MNGFLYNLLFNKSIMKNNIAIILSALSLLGIIYLVYQQNFSMPQRLKKCHEIAVNIEKSRHYPIDDLEVTNQDISGYMKNMTACLSD